jgi:glycosyltransferase involved in cell wall biosynthesis
MIRVCFITPTLNAGGIENYLLRFIRFAPDTIDITIICQKKGRGDLTDQYEALNVNIIYQPLGYLNFHSFKEYYKIFAINKFDVICDFNGNFAGVTVLLARLAKVNKRITFYRRSSNAFHPSKAKLLYNTFVNRLVYKYSTHILSNSEYALNYFFPVRKDSDKRFKVIYNGVDADLFKINSSKAEIRTRLGLPLNSFIIGHVGRYDVAKNHETIFKTAQKLKKQNLNVTFVFCGKNTDTEEFIKKIDEFDIRSKVVMLGLQKDVPFVMKAFDVFFFPSITEGQPNALIEAMLSDMPIVTSNIPPIKEVVPPDFLSKLVYPLDAETFSDLLTLMITDEETKLKYKLKRFAQENFNSTHRLQEFLNVLLEKSE